jgi:hypothetical protein
MHRPHRTADLWPSHHCYDALNPIRIDVDHDGQVIELKL